MPKALNKITKGGADYKRPPEIEGSIDTAFAHRFASSPSGNTAIRSAGEVVG